MPHYSDYGGTSYSDEGEDSEERDLELGENIYLRENSIYTIVDGPSWTEAEANANKLGGHLVTINDAEENQWLVDNFPNEPSWYTYWIGLNDAKEENVFQWSSGENFIYSNWRPTSGPNRDPEDKSSLGASYVEFQVNDLNESKAGQWNDHPPNHPNSPVGIAEIPFVRRGDSAYVIVEGTTWEEAEANANELGGIIHSLPIFVTKLSFLKTFGSTIPEFTFVNILNSLDTRAS